MARRRRRRRTTRANLGMPTRQDFEAFAGLFCRYKAPDGLVHAVADHFGRQNPRFSADRFVAATRKC